MNQRTLLLAAAAILAVGVLIAGVRIWQQTHHRSADQEILIRKAS